MNRKEYEDVDQASGMATERAETVGELALAVTVHAGGQVETVDGREETVDKQIEQTAAECVEQAVYEREVVDEEQTTIESGGGAVCVQSATGEVTAERAVARVRIRWGSNNSKKYDGKVEDVPAHWVTDGSLAVGGIATVNVGGGRSWAGRVIEVFYQENPLDLALPVKRTSHQSPVICTPM